ncbi:Glycosyltransferase [Methanosarcina barkeri str. Wiesmoor]|uniref:Glycosyltransferase n=2 Tax=Methanosarcina barkeri TaxID=2208 RepID=A0A0E3QPJ0_METBA|nr:glycosyltransferase family 4 protein [Methanosarcina barkeri]AKB51854.1 Glycosyltransferase [Methanosarcina barkeri str. Wiesmoor]
MAKENKIPKRNYLRIKQMNIHYLTDIYFGEKNAGTTHTLEIYNNLSKKNEVHLICQKPQTEIEIKNKCYIPLFGTKRVKRTILLNFLFWMIYPLYILIKKKPDIFYQRFDGTLFLSPSLIFSKLFNIPLVMEVNGNMLDEISMRHEPQVYVKLIKLCEKSYYSKASRIITVTEGIKQEIIKKYRIPEEKIEVIGNGVNTDIFRPLNKRSNLKTKYGLDKNNVVAFAGILVEWQGLKYLIEAAPAILKEETETIFLIIGDGPLKNDLIQKVKDLNIDKKFIFTGFVSYDEVPLYINASDVCVVPKIPLKSGYSPLKLYEYMACGKAVIASDVRGFEILNQVKAGVLVEPQNSQKLSEAILQVLKDGALKNEMGKRGRNEVLMHYSWGNVAQKTEELFINTLNENYINSKRLRASSRL